MTLASGKRFPSPWNSSSEEPVPDQPKRRRWSVMDGIVVAITLNVVLTFAYHLTGLTLINTAIDGLALATIIGCLAVIVASHGLNRREAVLAFLLFLSLVCSWAAHPQATNVVDVVKFVGIFILFYAARSSHSQCRFAAPALALMAALPFVFLLIGESRVFTGPEQRFAFFPNRNTGALFYTGVLFGFSALTSKPLFPFQAIVAVAAQKVGVILSSALAVILWIALRPSLRSVALLLVASLLFGIAYISGLLYRPINLVTGLLGSVSSVGLETLSRSSFDSLLGHTGTSDLSGYFRIIHWANIISLYRDGGLTVWLFGYGAGHTPVSSALHLVPHNDYLKVLAETGIIPFAAFVAFLALRLSLLVNLSCRVLFTVLVIYFFSENLLNNFAAMALFFSFSGTASRDSRLYKLKLLRESGRSSRPPASRPTGPRPPRGSHLS